MPGPGIEPPTTTLPRLSSLFTVEPSGDIPAMLKPDVQSEMTHLVVDEVTIRDKLERLNVCKSVVPDGIHQRILKEQCDYICKPSEVTDSLESDHLCVISCFDVSVARSCPFYRYVRNIRGIDRSAFVADFETELVGIGHSLSADQYNVTLLSVLDKHAPAAKSDRTHVLPLVWLGQGRSALG